MWILRLGDDYIQAQNIHRVRGPDFSATADKIGIQAKKLWLLLDPVLIGKTGCG
jgi:hypothetical protein